MDAFNNLGVLYKEGHGIEMDYNKAFYLFTKAAESNIPTAQYNLGQMYDQGHGCEADQEKALEWCRKAAYGGHEKAKNIIAQLQSDGKIVF